MEIGTSHFTRGPSSKSQVWHGRLHGNTFWRGGLGLVLTIGLNQKSDSTLNTSHMKNFIGKELRSNFNDNRPYINGSLRLQRWDFALHVGTRLPYHEWDLGPGTWDPMWTGPYSPCQIWYKLVMTTVLKNGLIIIELYIQLVAPFSSICWILEKCVV